MIQKYKKVCFKSTKSMIQKNMRVLNTKKVQRIKKYKKNCNLKKRKVVHKKYTYSSV